jgi:hypothetical protein
MAALVEEPRAGDSGRDRLGDVVRRAWNAVICCMREVAKPGVWKNPGGTLET